MNKLVAAHEHLEKTVAYLQEVRSEEGQAKIVCQILLQMEQRLRLDQAHLGTLIGLKSQATVRTSSKPRPDGAKSAKRRRPKRP